MEKAGRRLLLIVPMFIMILDLALISVAFILQPKVRTLYLSVTIHKTEQWVMSDIHFNYVLTKYYFSQFMDVSRGGWRGLVNPRPTKTKIYVYF